MRNESHLRGDRYRESRVTPLEWWLAVLPTYATASVWLVVIVAHRAGTRDIIRRQAHRGARDAADYAEFTRITRHLEQP